ncbi:MAG: hypothetical protein GX803_08275 [Lentisphaerae bacterium]|jgi:hypothetical protein|nr:hypothetical protein [Lentisphaerota bacterium]
MAAPPRPVSVFPRVAFRVAVAATLIFSLVIFHIQHQEVARQAAPTPLDVLMAAQRGDGGWAVSGEQPRPQYDVAVTALAVLALIQSGPAPLDEPLAPALRAGVDFLIRTQNRDGQFGPAFSGLKFTQYLAAKALGAAADLPDADPAWQTAALRARERMPAEHQMVALNRQLAQPQSFPGNWADAGGPAVQAALELLKR